MATEIQTIKASQLEELTEVTELNYVVVTDGATSKKVKATNLKGNSLTSEQAQQLTTAYEHSQTPHVSADDIPTNISDLTNDSGFITSSDLPTVPTKVSDLANDKNYISSIPSEYVTETELNAKGYLTSHQDISNLQSKTDNNLATTSKEVVGAINEVKILNDTKLNKTDANKLNCVSIDNGSLKEYILTNCTETGKTYYLIAKTTCTDLPKASNFYITVETPGLYTYKVTAKELNDSNGIYVCTYRTISSTWTAWEKVCTTTVADVTETPIEFDKTALGLTISNNRSIYKVINGICYVTIELLVDAPSENKSYGYTKVNTTNLPKIGFNTKYIINVEGANSTISAVLDKGTTEMKFHGNILTKEGTYIIQGSFSYPVAES